MTIKIFLYALIAWAASMALTATLGSILMEVDIVKLLFVNLATFVGFITSLSIALIGGK